MVLRDQAPDSSPRSTTSYSPTVPQTVSVDGLWLLSPLSPGHTVDSKMQERLEAAQTSLVVKHAASGPVCLALNLGPATSCVTLVRLLHLSVL